MKSQRHTDSTLPNIGPFLAALGGMPLAIKLVAQRAEPYDSLARYWEEWNQYAAGISLAANPQTRRQTDVGLAICRFFAALQPLDGSRAEAL